MKFKSKKKILKLFGNLYMLNKDFCMFAWLGCEFQYLLLTVPCIL